MANQQVPAPLAVDPKAAISPVQTPGVVQLS
jgi:hypothetical protein